MGTLLTRAGVRFRRAQVASRAGSSSLPRSGGDAAGRQSGRRGGLLNRDRPHCRASAPRALSAALRPFGRMLAPLPPPAGEAKVWFGEASLASTTSPNTTPQGGGVAEGARRESQVSGLKSRVSYPLSQVSSLVSRISALSCSAPSTISGCANTANPPPVCQKMTSWSPPIRPDRISCWRP